ncbi:MAG: hypothetical protein ACERKD_09515 [Prolixibacteraceae bacterium]
MKKIIYISLMLFFIASCEEESYYPLASYEIVNQFGTFGFMYILDASKSVSLANTDTTLFYRWDINGDHAAEWDTDWQSTSKQYFIPETSLAIVGLEVKDALGHVSEFYKKTDLNFNSSAYSIYTNNTSKFKNSVIRYHEISQMWVKSNLYNADSIGILNPFETNPIQSGSYYTWTGAMERFNTKIESEFPNEDDLWAVPSLEEWQTLIDYFGTVEVAGFNLGIDVKESIHLIKSGWVINNHLEEYGEAGYYWTSTKMDDQHAYAIKISANNYKAETVILPMDVAASVRLCSQYKNE